MKSPLVALGTALVATLAAAAVLAPVVAPYDPRSLAGSALEPPSAQHLLGTDLIGQDVWSGIVWGARSSLGVGVGAATVAVVVGLVVGVWAALAGGAAEIVAMRTVDVLLAVPRLPLLVVVAALAGMTEVGLALTMGALFWPPVARIVRSQTLSMKGRGFVAAAKGFGGGLGYLAGRHLLPALGPIIVSVFVASAGHAIMLEAALAFLGLADPVGVSWGLMLNKALVEPGLYFTPAWTWLVLPPGFAITLAVLGFTFLGVGLEPAFNPRSARAG